jgi:hypothetical protein
LSWRFVKLCLSHNTFHIFIFCALTLLQIQLSLNPNEQVCAIGVSSPFVSSVTEVDSPSYKVGAKRPADAMDTQNIGEEPRHQQAIVSPTKRTPLLDIATQHEDKKCPIIVLTRTGVQIYRYDSFLLII